MEAFSKFFDSSHPAIYNFNCGFVSGVIFVLAIIVLVILIKIIYMLFFRYPRRAQGVGVEGAHGKIFVSTQAILDLVQSILRKEYPYIKVNKLKLMDRKSRFTLVLDMDFDPDRTSLPLIEAELGQRILTQINKTFGIESIKEINTRNHRLKSSLSEPVASIGETTS